MGHILCLNIVKVSALFFNKLCFNGVQYNLTYPDCRSWTPPADDPQPENRASGAQRANDPSLSRFSPAPRHQCSECNYDAVLWPLFEDLTKKKSNFYMEVFLDRVEVSFMRVLC